MEKAAKELKKVGEKTQSILRPILDNAIKTNNVSDLRNWLDLYDEVRTDCKKQLAHKKSLEELAPQIQKRKKNLVYAKC